MYDVHEPHEDPRVTRTRTKVLDVVRAILDRDGPMGVSYSAVAKGSGVGRQTLYNHWAAPEEMIRDAAVEERAAGTPAEASSPEDAVRQWLRSLARVLADGAEQAVMSSLVAVAPHSPDGETSLRALAAERVAEFNELLAPFSRTCSPETFALMVGPVTYQTLLARQPVTEALIERVVATVTPALSRVDS